MTKIELIGPLYSIVTTIFDGAESVSDIAAALGRSEINVSRLLLEISDKIVERDRGKHRKQAEAISIIVNQGIESFYVVDDEITLSVYYEDYTPVEPPGIMWPDYSMHNLVFAEMK